jgi:hypothetical protein
MALPVEDTRLRHQALAYAIELYDELTEENGAPTLGTQNQAVDFILADRDFCRAVAAWAGTRDIDEASTAPPSRLRQDELYWRVRAFMEEIMGRPVFASPGQIHP